MLIVTEQCELFTFTVENMILLVSVFLGFHRHIFYHFNAINYSDIAGTVVLHYCENSSLLSSGFQCRDCRGFWKYAILEHGGTRKKGDWSLGIEL